MSGGDWRCLENAFPLPQYDRKAFEWLEPWSSEARSQVLSGQLSRCIAPPVFRSQPLLQLFDVEGEGHCFSVSAHQWARFHEPQITGGMVHFLSEGSLAEQLGRCLAFYRACCACMSRVCPPISIDDVIDWEVVGEEATCTRHKNLGRKRIERGNLDIVVQFELDDGIVFGAAVEAKFDHTLTPGQLQKYTNHLKDNRRWALEVTPLLLVTRTPEDLRAERHWQSTTWWRFLIAFERELDTDECKEFRRFRRTVWKAAYEQ